jgi:hypothetical protein
MKRPVKEWADILLSDYRWYRKLRGGVWFQIRVIPLQGCLTPWVRQPLGFETVIDMEIY